MSMSELATAMPTSGGIYVYTDRTFGPFLGTLVGFGLWLSLLLKCAFALVGFGQYLSPFTSFSPTSGCLILLGFITLLNIRGVGKITGALAYIVYACLIMIFFIGSSSYNDTDFSRLTPFITHGPQGFLISISLAVGSFAGLTKLVAIAEEVKDPEINMSKGVLYSLFFVAFLYILSSVLLTISLPAHSISGNFKPFYTLARQTMGDWGGWTMAGVALMTLASMANAGVLAASRFPFAMSRDQLMPNVLGKIGKITLTPYMSIIFSAVLIGLIIVLFDVVKIAKLASVFIIMMFILVNFIVIILRENNVQWYKPGYRSPLYPYQHILSSLVGIFLLYSMGKLTCLIYGPYSWNPSVFFLRKKEN